MHIEHEQSHKKVLITGASRGIGHAIAVAASEAGYSIVAHYNHGEAEAVALRETIQARGGTCELLQFDVANRAECRERLDSVGAALWGIVCNAGIHADNTFAALTDENWDSVIHTNLDGFYNVLQPLIMPLCRKKQGRIVTMASASGIMGNRGQVNYSASKAGVIGASKALAVELASRNITVNCVAPGVIETNMIADAPLDMILPAIPMRRVGKPEEVAALVVFLLSDAAAYITRQVISVNGGLV
ncbi:MAG: 3-oxoacyl-ACP reductase FabG [Treponema sp.]|jgi:3-oxoacyl-[acyl-carrier protein] reductase|nr:3-oxoacyl-ACP reductase FabG [Treponema sp.]